MTNENLGAQPLQPPSFPPSWSQDWPQFLAWRQRMSEKALFGVSTGIAAVDKATRGLKGLVVLNGLPGLGKTCLFLQIAIDAAIAGSIVIYVLTEMTSFLLYTRTLARLARASFWDVIDQRPEKLGALVEAENRLTTFWDRVFIVDSRAATVGRFSIQHLQWWVSTITQSRGVAPLVIVDHVQNIDTGFPSTGLKDRMDAVAASLAQLAGVYDTTVLAISEKNRASYESASMGSSMGSASWEYSADILMSLMTEDEHRDRTAKAAGRAQRKGSGKDLGLAESGANEAGFKRPVDLVIIKQRLMPPTTVPLMFYPTMSMFTNR